MVKRLSVEDIAADIGRLGVGSSDVLYVRARSSAVGKTESSDTLLRALLNAVGPDGTLVLPAFTGYGSRWRGSKRSFSRESPTESGALSRLALSEPGAVRSMHPSHSFVAIGPAAGSLLSGHDHTKPAFDPVGRMVECGAKMLLIGCNRESPGFSTVHYAQEQLGLSRRHLTKHLYSVRIVSAGREVDWHPSEDPGCSRGFDKLYRHYVHEEILRTGSIGRAYSILAEAKPLYEIDRRVLSVDPLAVICDDPLCLSCRGLRVYNWSAMPLALARISSRALKRRVQTIWSTRASETP